jgi:multicomponent Na+:H+ antiporter subunit B
MSLFFDLSLLALLIIIAFAIARTKDLFAAVMYSGIYGLLSASFFILSDAVDVAITEAAVGAGIFPILMLVLLSFVGRYENEEHRSLKPRIIPLLITLGCGAVLFTAFQQMPAFGSPDAPAHQHVADRYLEQSYEEIHIPNVVTSVLASYRGFDTLGEVVVIFTAAISVFAVLLGVQGWGQRQLTKPASMSNMSSHKVLRIVGKMLIPLIMLFGLYVQFHGEYGPGGGFQAGVIFAAAIILYSMLFGMKSALEVVPLSALRLLTALGVLIYGSVGITSLLAGGNFLDYSVLLPDPVAGQHVGIIVIELGIGITVAASMALIFFAFALESISAGDSDK